MGKVIPTLTNTSYITQILPQNCPKTALKLQQNCLKTSLNLVILAPFEAFKTLFGQGSLGISRWSIVNTIGHVGCEIHYSHDVHHGYVGHD